MTKRAEQSLTERLALKAPEMKAEEEVLRASIQALRGKIADAGRELEAHFAEKRDEVAKRTGNFVSRCFRVHIRNSVTLEWGNMIPLKKAGKVKFMTIEGKKRNSPTYKLKDLLDKQPPELHGTITEVEARAIELREMLLQLTSFNLSMQTITNRINKIASLKAIETAANDSDSGEF
jgi:hypothetical protein